MVYRVGAGLLLLGASGFRDAVRAGEREGSFRPFAEDRVSGVALSEDISRAPPPWSPAACPPGGERTAGGWNLRLDVKEGKTTTVRIGSSILLTRDGHFLTAVHNLVQPPDAIALLEEGGVDFAEATIVWSGNPMVPEEGFAVVKAARRPVELVDWDDADAVPPGDGVGVDERGSRALRGQDSGGLAIRDPQASLRGPEPAPRPAAPAGG